MKTNRIFLVKVQILCLFFLFFPLVLIDQTHAEIIDEEVAPIPSPKSDSPSKNMPNQIEPLLDNVKSGKQKEDIEKLAIPGNKEKESNIGKDEKKEKITSKQPSQPRAKAKESVPVHFTSQGLKGLREKGLVELMKDVLVTQGDLKIEADNAQVFFNEESKEVKKIIAMGQPVKMSNIDPNTGEKLEAVGNQVEFNNSERVVLLEGNARIKKGNNSTIKGKKITYELDSGWIKADKVAGEISPQRN